MTSNLAPFMNYRDPIQAADWLSEAFGIDRETEATDSSGNLLYIRMRLGDSHLLIGSATGASEDASTTEPSQLSGSRLLDLYLSVEDITPAFERATAAGAPVLEQPYTDDEGFSYFVCSDIGGYTWTIGTRPFATSNAPPPPAMEAVLGPSAASARAARSVNFGVTAAAVVLTMLAASGVTYWFARDSSAAKVAELRGTVAELTTSVEHERQAREAAEDLANTATRFRETAQGRITQFTSRIKSLEAEQDSLSEAARKTETDLAAAQAEIERVTELANIERERVQRLEAESSELRAELASEHAEQDRLQTALTTARSELEAATAATERVMAEKAALESSIAANETALRERERLLEEADAYQSRIAGLMTEVQSLRNQTEALADQIKATSEERDENARKLSEAIEQVEIRDARIAAFEAEIANLKELLQQPAASAPQRQPSGDADEAVALATGSMAPEETSQPPLPTKVTKRPLHRSAESDAAVTRTANASNVAGPPRDLDNTCGRTLWSALDRISRREQRVTDIRRMCNGIPNSAEPAKCLREILAGKVDWGGGTQWKLEYAVQLCTRTTSAATTISCFRQWINVGESWRTGISECAAE